MSTIPQQAPPADGARPIPMQLRPQGSTPVYGTAQLARGGVAESLRTQAYALPAHDPKRWLMLLAADRAEVAAHLAREAATPGQQALAVRHFARQVRAYPTNTAVLAALAALLVGRLIRR